MRILKLLQELYLELKVFNENVEYFTCLKYEKEHRRENPMRGMTEKEKISLKRWINKRIEEENVNVNDLPVDGYVIRNIHKFLDGDTKCGGVRARRSVSEALGYGSFAELLAAYRQQTEGGAA